MPSVFPNDQKLPIVHAMEQVAKQKIHKPAHKAAAEAASLLTDALLRSGGAEMCVMASMILSRIFEKLGIVHELKVGSLCIEKSTLGRHTNTPHTWITIDKLPLNVTGNNLITELQYVTLYGKTTESMQSLRKLIGDTRCCSFIEVWSKPYIMDNFISYNILGNEVKTWNNSKFDYMLVTDTNDVPPNSFECDSTISVDVMQEMVSNPTLYEKRMPQEIKGFYYTAIREITQQVSYTKKSKMLEAMTVKEMKQELEAYGVCTSSFLEKHELLAALKQARRESQRKV